MASTVAMMAVERCVAKARLNFDLDASRKTRDVDKPHSQLDQLHNRPLRLLYKHELCTDDYRKRAHICCPQDV